MKHNKMTESSINRLNLVYMSLHADLDDTVELEKCATYISTEIFKCRENNAIL